ncbi:Scn11a [Symbiodinium sp. CCMP2592]|nr:Scn11a [Symbiodinium sp. CCMP2592]
MSFEPYKPLKCLTPTGRASALLRSFRHRPTLCTIDFSGCIALIQAFFHAVDVNHNGEISLDELRFFLDDATMEAFFRTLGFDVYDKQRFMELLDVDDSGEVSYEEFLEGCMRYRGVAQGVDVHTVIRHLGRALASHVPQTMPPWLQHSVNALHADLADFTKPGQSLESRAPPPGKVPGKRRPMMGL